MKSFFVVKLRCRTDSCYSLPDISEVPTYNLPQHGVRGLTQGQKKHGVISEAGTTRSNSSTNVHESGNTTSMVHAASCSKQVVAAGMHEVDHKSPGIYREGHKVLSSQGRYLLGH
jgi:hypothetical protein